MLLLDFLVFWLNIGSKMSIFDAYWLNSNLISLKIQFYFLTRYRFCSLFVSTTKELSIRFYWTVHNFRTIATSSCSTRLHRNQIYSNSMFQHQNSNKMVIVCRKGSWPLIKYLVGLNLWWHFFNRSFRPSFTLLGTKGPIGLLLLKRKNIY